MNMKNKWFVIGAVAALAACGKSKDEEKKVVPLPQGCSESLLKMETVDESAKEISFAEIPNNSFLRAENVTFVADLKDGDKTSAFRMEESFEVTQANEVSSDLQLKCQTGFDSSEGSDQMAGSALISFLKVKGDPELSFRAYKIKSDGESLRVSSENDKSSSGKSKKPGETILKSGWLEQKLYRLKNGQYELHLKNEIEVEGKKVLTWIVVRYVALGEKQ